MTCKIVDSAFIFAIMLWNILCLNFSSIRILTKFGHSMQSIVNKKKREVYEPAPPFPRGGVPF